MDELALLKGFRLDDAATDGAREHARAALRAAMTRRRFPRRRYAVALAFAAAALLAAAAYAIVHQFVIGSAAPKTVQDQIGIRMNLGAPIPIAGQGPYQLAGPALIAAADDTPKGPVYFLVAKVRGGGDCQYVWYMGQRQPNGGPITSGGCEFGKRPHP